MVEITSEPISEELRNLYRKNLVQMKSEIDRYYDNPPDQIRKTQTAFIRGFLRAAYCSLNYGGYLELIEHIRSYGFEPCRIPERKEEPPLLKYLKEDDHEL